MDSHAPVPWRAAHCDKSVTRYLGLNPPGVLDFEAEVYVTEAGHEPSGLVSVRDGVAELMTPADLSEAQRRAREWHAAHQLP